MVGGAHDQSIGAPGMRQVGPALGPHERGGEARRGEGVDEFAWQRPRAHHHHARGEWGATPESSSFEWNDEVAGLDQCPHERFRFRVRNGEARRENR